jgi:hypothetical protein
LKRKPLCPMALCRGRSCDTKKIKHCEKGHDNKLSLSGPNAWEGQYLPLDFHPAATLLLRCSAGSRVARSQ